MSSGSGWSLGLAATEPLASIYRSVTSYAALLATGIAGSPGEMTPAQLSEAVRPLLDEFHAKQVAAVRQLLQERENQGRAILDLAQAARAATGGRHRYPARGHGPGDSRLR